MSLEAFGDGGDVLDGDFLYSRGWESDADCNVWWKTGYEEKKYSFAEACKIEEERQSELL